MAIMAGMAAGWRAQTGRRTSYFCCTSLSTRRMAAASCRGTVNLTNQRHRHVSAAGNMSTPSYYRDNPWLARHSAALYPIARVWDKVLVTRSYRVNQLMWGNLEAWRCCWSVHVRIKISPDLYDFLLPVESPNLSWEIQNWKLFQTKDRKIDKNTWGCRRRLLETAGVDF